MKEMSENMISGDKYMWSITISLLRIHGWPEIFVSKALLLLFYEVREFAIKDGGRPGLGGAMSPPIFFFF